MYFFFKIGFNLINILLNYSWHTVLYYFQVYSTVIWQFYTLHSAHQVKCSYQPSP